MHLDIARTNADNDIVAVLLGKGDGMFQSQVKYSTGSSPMSVTAADFNHDKKLDLAIANNNDNNTSVLLGNGDGTFQKPRTF